jgi:DNA mismatch endonuclease (patch repair protein)
MADMFSKTKRSQIMAAVRSTGNRVTEVTLANLLRRNGVRGWRRHLPLTGKPDFTFRAKRVVVFIDGCFWHGCRIHLRMPSSNRTYWFNKIARNQARDRVVTRELRRAGWRVLRLWEHELRDESRVLRRVTNALRVDQR